MPAKTADQKRLEFLTRRQQTLGANMPKEEVVELATLQGQAGDGHLHKYQMRGKIPQAQNIGAVVSGRHVLGGG